jgi:hypothetical protein
MEKHRSPSIAYTAATGVRWSCHRCGASGVDEVVDDVEQTEPRRTMANSCVIQDEVLAVQRKSKGGLRRCKNCRGRRSAKRRRLSPVLVELVLETSAVIGSPVSGNSSAWLGRCVEVEEWWPDVQGDKTDREFIFPGAAHLDGEGRGDTHAGELFAPGKSWRRFKIRNECFPGVAHYM